VDPYSRMKGYPETVMVAAQGFQGLPECMPARS